MKAADHKEIERRFLVTDPPAGYREAPSRLVEQGYVATGETTVRLRRDGESACVLTVKRGAYPDTEEREINLATEQLEALWPLTAGRRISKTRYSIPLGEHTVEFDVFHGAHEGLLIAEVEFASREASEAFTPPGWFGEEITGDRGYSNAALARE